MTDFMFGDDPEIPPLEEGPDDYDEFNDETFGGEIEEDVEDWQNTHEKFSTGFGNTSFDDDYGKVESKRPNDSGCYSGERARIHEENLEESISKLVLDDEDDEEDMYGLEARKSQPIAIGGGATVGGSSNMSQLFGPSSPPALFDPQEFISPGSKKNIWGSPTTQKVTSNTEQHLKSMLNIRPLEDLQYEMDPAVVQAVPNAEPAKKVFTLEELEKDLTGRAPPQRTISPILGSPPMSKMMPVGTPPQHSFMQRTPAGMVHQQQLQLQKQKQQQQQQQQQQQAALKQQAMQQQLQSKSPGQPMTPQQQQLATTHAVQQLVQQIHQMVGGRVSPTHITKLVLTMQEASGRASPNQIRQLIMANTGQGSASPFPRPMGPGATPTKGMAPPPGMTPPTGGPPLRTPMQQQQQQQQKQQQQQQQKQQQQQRFGSPMMPQQRPMSPMMHQQRQGSPMMQQGRPPMMPFSPGGMMGGGPHPRTPQGMRGPRPGPGPGPGRNMNTFGLTPMHPHIPPMRPFSDPGMRRRFPYNNQQRPYSQTPNRYGDRHQRPYHNRYHDNEQRRPGPGGDANTDDYANLMTLREKEWVQKIQMLQLQSNNPEVDDYYYQAYMQKKQGQEEQSKEGVQAEKKKKNDKEPSKIINAKTLETRVYQPAQYEGALGRVTSSSVNNPRQLIDFHIEAVGEEEEGAKPSAAKEQCKKRRTLLSVERVYGILLQLDDLEKQVLTLPESDRVTLSEKRQNLMGVVYAHLKPEAVLCDRPSDDHFIQVLSVRKGRKLLARVLPLLDKEAQCVVQAILRHLSLLLKKESQEMRKEMQESQKTSAQETLPMVFPPVWRCIQTTTLPELTSMVKQLMAGASGVSPSRQYGSVISVYMQNKFGVSVILCLLSQGERIFTNTSLVDLEEDTQNDWVDCVNLFAKDICVVADTAIPQPLVTVNNVLPHFARFVSKQTFNALEKRLRSITEEKTTQ